MNVFVLHGTFGSPYENWFGWLNKKLNEASVDCMNPHLSTPTSQTFENWSKIVDAYIDCGLVNKR